MDAVQKVGNGHPGTAMSLAPAAYLLFQKVMRHNPADPHWPGRDRFVLSCGHSSLTLYIQLYLGGWGLELEDLKSLRTWGSKTPGHPEYGHTAGVETTTGPLGQGIGNAVGMAMAARREHGLLDPNAAPGESLFDHQIYALRQRRRHRGGRQLRGLLHRRHPAAGQPDPDLRRQQDLDRGRHRRRALRGRREALRGLRLARPGRRLDERRLGYKEDVPALYKAIAGGRARHRPAQHHRAAHDHRLARAERAEHRRGPRLRPRRRRGRRHQEDPGLRPRRRPSRSPRTSSSTPARRVERGKEAQAAGTSSTPPGPASPRRRRTASTGCRRARCPTAGTTTCRRCRPTRRASPPARRPAPSSTRSPADARALGRLGRPRRVEQHHDRGRTLLHPEEPLHQDLAGRPVRRARAPLRHPRARHGRDPQRHRRSTAAPASSGRRS